MKAVILAAGEGIRLRPITYSRPKPMIPLLGKPLLEHIILGLNSIGINHILIIVGYKQEIIKEYFKKAALNLNIKIDYIIQEEYFGFIRKKAIKNLKNQRIKIEEFKSSLLDGIAIRETIRNWAFKQKIYVNNIQKIYFNRDYWMI